MKPLHRLAVRTGAAIGGYCVGITACFASVFCVVFTAIRSGEIERLLFQRQRLSFLLCALGLYAWIEVCAQAIAWMTVYIELAARRYLLARERAAARGRIELLMQDDRTTLVSVIRDASCPDQRTTLLRLVK
jgi:hypothetical protein